MQVWYRIVDNTNSIVRKPRVPTMFEEVIYII